MNDDEQRRAEALAWAESEPVEVEAETIDPAAVLTLNARKLPERTAANVAAALEADPATRGRIRMSKLDNRVYLTLPLPFPGHDGAGVVEMTPREQREIRAYLEERYSLRGRDEIEEGTLLVAGRHQFDPILEAFAALPMWDGMPRAGHLMHWFLGAPDDAYTQAAERLLLSAVIMRTYHPGCKFDLVPVLIGPQGIGKSTFARLAALSDEWFTDSLMGIGTKEAFEILQGNAIAELGELAPLRGKPEAAVKGFISSQGDEYRTPWDRLATKHPRRCVFVDTTNDGQFLRDKTGNRRYLPVRCGEVAASLDLFADGARREFEQAYAELLHERSLCGALPLTLPPEAEQAAKEAREAANVEDGRVGIIDEWLRSQGPGGLVCAAQVGEHALGLERNGAQWRRQTREIGQILESSFPELERLPKKKRISGYGPQTAYRLPDEWPATDADGGE